MFAIVNILGKQYKVSKGQQLYVHRLEAEAGDNVTFDEVLLTSDGSTVNVGTPALGHSVKAKVLDHLKDDKVIVFKKKRRKGYKVKNGHRQYLTKIEIEDILTSGGKKTTALSESSVSTSAPKKKKTSAKPTAKATEVKADTKATEKPATKKAETKPEAKKDTTKAGIAADTTTPKKDAPQAKADTKATEKPAAKKAEAKPAAKKPTKKASGKGDDLTKIEGIGPKIKGLLQDDGIMTFSDLANASVDRLNEILAAAGSRYTMHNPSTWPKQAKYAADDKWDELKEYQDKLDGGRE